MKVVPILIASALLTGCGASDQSALEKRVAALERANVPHWTNTFSFEEATNSQAPLSALDGLEKRLVKLEFEELLRSFKPLTVIDATAPEGYQKLESDLGMLLIKLRSAEPYLDGFKVRVAIGNPHSIRLSGMFLYARIGTNAERKFEFTRDFLAGQWSDVEMTFAPARADELKRINIRAVTDKVSLLEPLKP